MLCSTFLSSSKYWDYNPQICSPQCLFFLFKRLKCPFLPFSFSEILLLKSDPLNKGSERTKKGRKWRDIATSCNKQFNIMSCTENPSKPLNNCMQLFPYFSESIIFHIHKKNENRSRGITKVISASQSTLRLSDERQNLNI